MIKAIGSAKGTANIIINITMNEYNKKIEETDNMVEELIYDVNYLIAKVNALADALNTALRFSNAEIDAIDNPPINHEDIRLKIQKLREGAHTVRQT